MIRSIPHSGITENRSSVLQNGLRAEPVALNLVRKLCQALAAEEISYCHWKSNNALDRSASGANDLDLLVSRADGLRFTELLARLGFKQAKAPPDKQMTGVLDYFGYDEEADKLIHVHVHYQLVLGHDMSKNYRLPLEQPYLASAVQGELFKVPAPEFEFIVFVIRMGLKHLPWDVVLGGEGRLKKTERQELAYLQSRINQERVVELLQQHLPAIDVALFTDSVQALQPTCPLWQRVQTGQQLLRRLQANGRRALLIDPWLKLWRRATLAIGRRLFKSSAKYRPASGGAMIAIVGGDGAGKSTAVNALVDWLAKNFETTQVHMGKPAWSWTTAIVRTILKVGHLLGLYQAESTVRETFQRSAPARIGAQSYQKSLVSPGYPWLLRELCRARDRYWTYVKARRFAAQGGLVILDRFPLSQIQIMDGPLIRQFVDRFTDGAHTDQFLAPQPAGRLVKFLARLEERYYQQIAQPDLLVVLRVEPTIAVQRKTEEDADAVHERSTAIWQVNWADTGAHVIDGSQPKTAVQAELKTLLWSEL